MAPVRPPAFDAMSWYVPATAIERSLNVAVPATAALEVVPPRSVEGSVTSDTLAVLDTRLPYMSSTSTVTAGEIAARAAVLAGWVLKASFVGAAASTWIPDCVPVIELYTMSVAVIDCVPAVFSVAKSVTWPASSALNV